MHSLPLEHALAALQMGLEAVHAVDEVATVLVWEVLHPEAAENPVTAENSVAAEKAALAARPEAAENPAH